jgi:hypothetical protein
MITIIGSQDHFISGHGYVAATVGGEQVVEIVCDRVEKAIKLAACVIEELGK